MMASSNRNGNTLFDVFYRQSLVGSDQFSSDTVLEILSNQRRRFAIHYLKQQNGTPTAVSELGKRVASWENSKPVEKLSHQERKRVVNALRQFHLPKMADLGFIEHDSSHGTVVLTKAASQTDFYVDSITGGNIPWGIYYLGFSALSVIWVFLFHSGLFSLTFMSTAMSLSFFVTALVVSSVGHFYDNYYRMRLGAGDRPPEVGER